MFLYLSIPINNYTIKICQTIWEQSKQILLSIFSYFTDDSSKLSKVAANDSIISKKKKQKLSQNPEDDTKGNKK